MARNLSKARELREISGFEERTSIEVRDKYGRLSHHISRAIDCSGSGVRVRYGGRWYELGGGIRTPYCIRLSEVL